ncbi:hypothetical protein L2E82_50540 [Cichorium intybus]|nr:hypothetical protein L2E82_50540 [Cichorium intybus]
MAATNVQSGDVGLNSPNSQRGVSSSWSQIVRCGGGEPEVIAPVVVAMVGSAPASPSRSSLTVENLPTYLLPFGSESFENPWGQYYGHGDLEMGTQQHNSNSAELGFNDFFKKVQAIDKQYEKLNKLLKKLQDAHEESMAVTKAAATKSIKQRMEKGVDEVGKIARLLNQKLRKLTRSSLKKKFKDKMSEFQTLRESIHQEHREVVQRRLYTGFRFKTDEIVQLWNEMYDVKRWQTGVPSFRLELLFRRRVSK